MRKARTAGRLERLVRLRHDQGAILRSDALQQEPWPTREAKPATACGPRSDRSAPATLKRASVLQKSQAQQRRPYTPALRAPERSARRTNKRAPLLRSSQTIRRLPQASPLRTCTRQALAKKHQRGGLKRRLLLIFADVTKAIFSQTSTKQIQNYRASQPNAAISRAGSIARFERRACSGVGLIA